MLRGRREWLSITPEPERELPRAIATLRAGGPPSRRAVELERRQAERLVLRGSRRGWLGWIEAVERLARSAEGEGPGLDSARRDALDVIGNHNALMRGLPGPEPRSELGARRED